MSVATTPAVVVGIDLGGTKVRAALADTRGRLLHRLTEPTRPGIALIAQLTDIVTRLSALDPDAPVAGTAIGGAGVPLPDGSGFTQAPNLGELGEVSLVAELRRRLGHPVVIENDVNIAALGELHAGAGRESESFAFVSVGTGIGVGLVLAGSIWPGVSGAAGEVGYLPFGSDPLDPRNQRRGALEEVVAGNVLAQRLPQPAGEPPLTAREVFAAAEAGDPLAVQALDTQARWLAHTLLAIDAVVDPGLYILGGGIGSRPELLAPLDHWLARLGRPGLRVRSSELGDDAPLHGAVHLALAAAITPSSLPRESEAS
ncbi:ROK family protein [Mycetocola sp. JXN-3]|uniref:ROK family protein n=1 Tax=Mycetocola sp. JXN-3 TaxID=2116510 RepID=UPI00165D2D07|nr:ROK family protein [Mycetocola sp. JXN-3]